MTTRLPRTIAALAGAIVASLASSLAAAPVQPPGAAPAGRAAAARPPNVVLIVADDLGYGDTGPYGQKLVATPALDRLAAEGLRFTQFYGGSTVCAPSRAVLMTGLHTGHASVRGNAPREDRAAQALRRGERTIAHLFKEAGYATGMFGKWGLGEIGSTGHPRVMGFDRFFGYLNQTHAHNYYPSFLIRDGERVALANVPEVEDPEIGSGYAREKREYSHDRIVEEALQWLAANEAGPFFLYLPATLPHANNEARRARGDGQEVPDYGPYAAKDWPAADKGQAAMIARLDRDVGRLLDLLAREGHDRDTIVFFTSDNGPHDEGGNAPERFDANGPLRGMKRSLYEGGIRVPLIARWPGHVPAGAVSGHVAYFGDFFATFCEILGRPLPKGLDSISFRRALTGEGRQRRHEYLYWEFYEQGGRQAVRFGDWKAIRQPGFGGPVELYDLARDLGETHDVATRHPALVARAVRMMQAAHVPDPHWSIKP